MTREAILYISEPVANSDSVLAAIEATGYEVVSTNSATQGIALLYIMHPVAAVVLHHRVGEHAGLNVARGLRAIHPDALIVLLCDEQTDCVPSYVDACIGIGQPLEGLIAAVRHLVATKCSKLLTA